jgi:hypothetical protein
VRLHKVIQPVADTDALHRFMGADIAPGGLIYLPFFDVDNVAQCLHLPDTFIPGQHLFAVFLLRPPVRLYGSARRFRSSDRLQRPAVA